MLKTAVLSQCVKIRFKVYVDFSNIHVFNILSEITKELNCFSPGTLVFTYAALSNLGTECKGIYFS